MASSGKQKRQHQNRQRRQARAARSAHAGEATAISRGEREAVRSSASARTTASSSAKGTPRAKRESPFKIPGQRAVVMAFLFSLVSAATLLLAPIQVQREVEPDDPRAIEAEADGEDLDVGDDGRVTVIEDAKLLDEEGLGVGLAVLMAPIAITGAAVAFTKRKQRSNAWTMAMVALSAYIFLFAGPYGVIALPCLIALAVGGFQSRRSEQKERLAEIKAAKQERAAGEGEVIDADATEVVDAGEADAGEIGDGDEAPRDDTETPG